MNTLKRGETWRDNYGEDWLIVCDDAPGDWPVVGHWSGGATLFSADGSRALHSEVRLVSRVEPKREPVECWITSRSGEVHAARESLEAAQEWTRIFGGTVHHMREVIDESDTTDKETAK
jgi:hypothetical protein